MQIIDWTKRKDMRSHVCEDINSILVHTQSPCLYGTQYESKSGIRFVEHEMRVMLHRSPKQSTVEWCAWKTEPLFFINPLFERKQRERSIDNERLECGKKSKGVQGFLGMVTCLARHLICIKMSVKRMVGEKFAEKP